MDNQTSAVGVLKTRDVVEPAVCPCAEAPARPRHEPWRAHARPSGRV